MAAILQNQTLVSKDRTTFSNMKIQEIFLKNPKPTVNLTISTNLPRLKKGEGTAGEVKEASPRLQAS